MYIKPSGRTLSALFLLTFIFTGISAQVTFTSQSDYRYLKGIEAVDLAANWYESDFDDSGWSSAVAPFRYGDGSGGTELLDMQGAYSTLFLRSTFTAAQLDEISTVYLKVDWDDGFIIWINDKQVLSREAPLTVSYDALASGQHESGIPENFSFSVEELGLLEGENSIAVMGCNITLAESSDFYFDMSINGRVELPKLPELIDSVGLSFSHSSGFIRENFNLTISSPEENAEIIYTLDGSNPQNSYTSIQGASPLSVSIDPGSTASRSLTPAVVVRASLIKDGFGASKPEARTFINLENVKSQTHPGGTWPPHNTSDRNVQFMDYEMDQEVINDAQYRDQMDAALLDLPSISLITDNAGLFDPDSGIYVNAEGQGKEWERECSVELINPDLSEGFNVNAGLRIRGGWSRHNDFPKHALRLFFREEYGDAKLEYPLFEDEGVSEFDKVDLRCSQNYSWANNSNSSYNTFVREVFTRDSQKDSGHPYTRSRYYHLYLNGMYWGIYQTQERSEARYASDYLGGDKEDYDVIKISGENYSKEIVATDGNLDKWKEVFDMTQRGFVSNQDYFFLEGKDENGMGIPGAEVFVDVGNLIDYMINVIYSGNYDSPVSAWGGNKRPNNFYAIANRERKSEGFRFFIHDGEHTLMNDPTAGPGVGLYENRANIGDRSGDDQMIVTGFDSFHSQWLHYKLTKNKEYRVRFANRAWEHLTGEGIFTPEISTERFNRRAEQIEQAIIAESARWGDTRTSTPYTKDNAWLPQLDMVRNDYFPVRPGIVIDQLKDLDLFPSIDAPLIEAEGEVIEENVRQISSYIILTLSRESSSGDIYYTLDGSDPRKIGGDPSSSAKLIASGASFSLSSSAVLRSRVLSNGSWSAERTITFLQEQGDYSDLKVTELHYHPLDSISGADTISGKSYEFIEFRNINSDKGINLSGLILDSAVYFEFPASSVLSPESYFVIASKPKSFYERYGLEPSGNYEKYFSNGGEQVVLRTGDGELIMDFTYDDDAPWPIMPDGMGSSLASVDINPQGDPNNHLYWTDGLRLHGTPFDYDLILSGQEESAEILKFNLQLYPNPTRDLLMLQLSGGEAYSSTLIIYDLQGSIIYQEEFVDYTEVSMRALNVSHGIYMLEVISQAGRAVKKVIYTP